MTDAEASRWCDEQTALLTAATAGLRERHPEVPVSIDVPRRRTVDTLVDASRSASMLVLGRHGGWGWAPARLGATVRAVLREAASPVMVVPLRTGGEAAADPQGSVAHAGRP